MASIRKDRKVGWDKEAKEVEVAAASGNTRRLFKLMRSTDELRISASETAYDRIGESIHHTTNGRLFGQMLREEV